MEMGNTQRMLTPRDTNNNISHFIPSVELKGTLAEKLRKLDTLIAYLEVLRRSLAGETMAARASHERPGMRPEGPARARIVAGALLGALFVLLLLGHLAHDIFVMS